MKNGAPSRRLSREDWLKLGLSRLSEAGVSALTLEQICQAAGKTKGSFYHHFSDHFAFLAALVAEWRRRNTLALIDEVNAQKDSKAGLKQLNRMVLEIDEALEKAIRNLAEVEPDLRPSVAAVDQERISYLAELHRQSEPKMKDEALLIAEVEYAAFIGHLVVWPDASRKQRDAASNIFETLVRDAYSAR